MAKSRILVMNEATLTETERERAFRLQDEMDAARMIMDNEQSIEAKQLGQEIYKQAATDLHEEIFGRPQKNAIIIPCKVNGSSVGLTYYNPTANVSFGE